jgi:hypothetical protein
MNGGGAHIWLRIALLFDKSLWDTAGQQRHTAQLDGTNKACSGTVAIVAATEQSFQSSFKGNHSVEGLHHCLVDVVENRTSA